MFYSVTIIVVIGCAKPPLIVLLFSRHVLLGDDHCCDWLCSLVVTGYAKPSLMVCFSAGMFYAVTIIVVMGVAKPLWLQLPTTGCSASSLGRRRSDSAYSSLEKKAMLISSADLNLGKGQCHYDFYNKKTKQKTWHLLER
jgi:hypothetical protein